ncbi:hypothetical protein EP232_05880 [bacterium]|nr:MAG: hypothetical protein EP232_05880 [bacterium]
MKSKTFYIFLISLIFLSVSQVMAVMEEPGEPGPWVVLDGVKAVIAGEPVLLSDVLMEHDLGLLEPTGDEKDFEALLNPYLNRLVILREAEEIGSFTLASGQIQGAYSGYLSRFEDREAFEAKLKQWGIDEQGVIRLLVRALTVSLYTESRIQYFIGVLPSEIEEAYQEDPERWGDKELFEVWNEIKEALQERAFNRERTRWLDTLWQRYQVDVFKEGTGETS